MPVRRIDDYGFLSDGHAPALVSKDGSVDWWCPPRADQAPVFGRLLDPHAGHWSLAPEDPLEVRRRYAPTASSSSPRSPRPAAKPW
jgi:GH15 family glucan-1,4-alpha-glucosidase